MSNGLSTQQIESSLERVREGDPKALEEVIELAYDRLRGLVRHILNRDFLKVRRLGHGTTSVQHEAVIRLIRGMANGASPKTTGDLTRLMAEMVRRALLDICRLTDRRIAQAEGGGASGNEDGLPDRSPVATTEDDPIHLVMWAQFHEQVEQLPEPERSVFQMRWYGGMTQQQIAECLGAERGESLSQRQVSRLWIRACVLLPPCVI